MEDIVVRLEKLARCVSHDEEALSTCEDAIATIKAMRKVCSATGNSGQMVMALSDGTSQDALFDLWKVLNSSQP